MLSKAAIGSAKNIAPKLLKATSKDGGVEPVHLRVGLLELDVAEARGRGGGPAQRKHPRREVDAERSAL